jgi:TetR/AcrR family transcriptional regulator, transcriptional repressor for nem operon
MSKAAQTRLIILQKAFELIYQKGYQTTSIDEIIATTKVTKGAFFYHFKSKDEMGLAIISEILQPTMEEFFIKPLLQNSDPKVVIYQLIEDLLLNNPFLKQEFGCPAANLTQEMTPWNSHFSKVLSLLTKKWVEAFVAALEKGKINGQIRQTVNAEQTALFVMSGYWGIRNFGKMSDDLAFYRAYLMELRDYLEGLA